MDTELKIFLFACLGAFILIGTAYYQYVQSKKSGKETEELLSKTTLQLSRTDELMRSQQELLMKATDQLSKTEEGLQNTRAVIESQQKLIASQEETIKQIVGGDGMPRVLVKVMDNYDAFMYEVKIGLINEDKYPIPNVQASVMDFDEISPKQSHDPRQQAQFIEEFLTSSGKYQQTVSLAPWSAHVLRTTVLKFVKPYQIYFVDVSWLKGKYDIMFRLILKDYVPAIEILRLSEGNVTVKESERDKFYLLGSDIFQRAQGQKAEIESRIEFERSKVPIFKF